MHASPQELYLFVLYFTLFLERLGDEGSSENLKLPVYFRQRSSFSELQS